MYLHWKMLVAVCSIRPHQPHSRQSVSNQHIREHETDQEQV